MAVSSSTKKFSEQEIRMDMTPMIDVTFLLLIFFLCTLNLKPLEGILLSHLPKDVGPSSSSVTKDPVEPTRIMLRRVEEPSNPPGPDEIMIVCDNHNYSGEEKYEDLHAYLSQRASRLDKMDVLIIADYYDAMTALHDVPHGEIIAVLDICHVINNSKDFKDKLNIKFHLNVLPEGGE